MSLWESSGDDSSVCQQKVASPEGTVITAYVYYVDLQYTGGDASPCQQLHAKVGIRATGWQTGHVFIKR